MVVVERERQVDMSPNVPGVAARCLQLECCCDICGRLVGEGKHAGNIKIHAYYSADVKCDVLTWSWWTLSERR